MTQDRDATIGTPHVEEADIERFLRGQMGPDALLAFARHLETCADCRARTAARADLDSGLRALEAETDGGDGHLDEIELHAFVDGRLDAARRPRAVAHLRGCPSCAAEVADLESFAAHIGPHRRWRGAHGAGLAAAAAVVVAILGPLGWRSRIDHQAVAPRGEGLPPAGSAASGRPPDTGVIGGGTAAPPADVATAAAGPTVVWLPLDVRGTRGADGQGTPSVSIFRETSELRLRVACGDADYPSYRVVLRTAGGADIFARDHVRPQPTAGGPLVEIGVPAETVPPGEYVLTLAGESGPVRGADIGKIVFRVGRR